MAAVVRSDLVLDAVVTRLQDISTSNTYYGGGSYLTSPVLVARGLMFAMEPDPGRLPMLRVGYIGEIRTSHMPGHRIRCDASILVQIWPLRVGRTAAQIVNDNHNLRADVISAIAEDPTLAGNVVLCTPKSHDGSDARPAGEDGPLWAAIEYAAFWHQSRTEH